MSRQFLGPNFPSSHRQFPRGAESSSRGSKGDQTLRCISVSEDMSESIDVQIQGERNLNVENRSMYEGFKKVQKQVYEENSLFLMRKYDKVYDYPLEWLHCGHF